MTNSIGNTAENRKDCLLKCEKCERFLPGWIDGAGNHYALGPPNNQCCEGYGLQEVQVKVPDEFANG